MPLERQKTASSKGIADLETMIDALASIYAIESLPQHKRDSYAQIFIDSKNATGRILKAAHSVVSKIRKHSPKENASRIKGRYTTVKDNEAYIIPIIETPFTKLSTDYKEVESYVVSKDVTVSFYKVSRSVLQGYTEGAIGTIEYGDNAGVSLVDSLHEVDVDKLTRDISRLNNIPSKEEMFIFEQDAYGRITDIKLRVPELMEREYLNIDNRASVTLSKAEGRYAEAQATHKYNKDWVAVANKDYEDNFSTNSKDFVWIGKDVTNKELKSHLQYSYR